MPNKKVQGPMLKLSENATTEHTFKPKMFIDPFVYIKI